MVLRRPEAKIVRALAVGLHLEHGGVLGVRLVAGVAGRADPHIEHAVRTDGDGAVVVLAGVGQVVDDPLELAEGAVAA